MRAHYGSHPIDQINRTIPSLYPPSWYCTVRCFYDYRRFSPKKRTRKLDPQVFNFDSFLPSIFHFLDGSPAKSKIPWGETFLLFILRFFEVTIEETSREFGFNSKNSSVVNTRLVKKDFGLLTPTGAELSAALEITPSCKWITMSLVDESVKHSLY